MKSVTIIAASNWPTCHVMAINRTAQCVPFETQKILITNRRPECDFDGELHSLPSWATKEWNTKVQNRLLLEELPKHVKTDVAIYCQWDGFAINPQHWTDEFLEYDYVGAPWTPLPPWNPVHRVGNGGLSIRSNKWLRTASKLKDKTFGHEDIRCCCDEFEYFAAAGCRIAPLELALKFSFEHPIPEFPQHSINDSFGFHDPRHFGSRPDLVIPVKQ